MEFQPPRGTDDLLPPASDAMLGLYEAAHRTARLYGFRYVETPTFEHTELFARTSGETSDVVTKEMYTFEDKGGRSLTLRPEQTAGIVRAYLAHAHDLPTPFKAYYVSQQFRHGRPQAGRLREFRQFGVETIGSAAPAADVEVDRGGRPVPPWAWPSPGRAARQLDRRRRVPAGLPREADRVPRAAPGPSSTRTAGRGSGPTRSECSTARSTGRRRSCSAPRSISENLCQACAEHFAAVRNGLDAAVGRVRARPPARPGAGLLHPDDLRVRVARRSRQAQAALGGGGRYDGLAEVLGGAPTPGVGFALGLDRILMALREEGATLPGELGIACFVVSIGDEASRVGARLVGDLRDAGIPAAAAFEERPLKAQLKMADRAGAAYAVILGEREVATGTATMKPLGDGDQEEVPIGDVVNWLSRTDWAAER